MAEQKQITVIDVGTSKVVTLVGEMAESGSDIVVSGVGIVPARGIKRGQIVDVKEAAECIRESLDGAEHTSATKITHVFANFSGSHVQSQTGTGTVAIGRGDQGVSQDDVNRALEQASSVNLPSNRDILHVIPQKFKVDEQDGIRSPQGMLGFRLEVSAEIITGAVSPMQNLSKCLRNAGVELQDVVLSSLASAEASLTPTEREMGCMVLDVGAGTSDLAIFVDGAVWHASVIDVGGWNFTNDLAYVLHLPLDISEKLKLQHGTCSLESPTLEHPVTVEGFGDDTQVTVIKRDVAEILHARAEELFDMIGQEIKRTGYDGLLPAGVILTGGAAQMPGIREVARNKLHLPVRIAMPAQLVGLVDAIQGPAFATSTGMLRSTMQEENARPARRRRGNSNLKGLGGWLKNLLPG
ncbi:MAG TPA: cell division protein FtsA [Thermoflexales bacterium]|nr:cell division protein FtsA [Thermoflexales bacterium]HQW36138.1 cell division protein FtsA [Thermoflexales bacterium]HQZ20908.1 cell division protein FtsA [Thermoflexales bacterium]HQZ98879.1 cell division protein FtsA [Thermoflexales bacterium]